MKKINVLFTEQQREAIDKLSSMSMNSRSEVSRAAMTIGLYYLLGNIEGATDREFYDSIIDNQELKGNDYE
jgi:hypothetical protein